MMNIAFLASGRGSNMQAVMDACAQDLIKARPCVVISNNSRSGAIENAVKRNIPRYHLSSATHADPDALDRAIADALARHETGLVLLAGYMKKLGPVTLARFRNRILNIHPALLPKFGGPGMYGHHVHEAVLASGDRETGVTIHVVNAEYDRGPIIAQSRVPVEKGDTPDILAARVLRQEHRLLVDTVRKVASGEISLPRA